MALILIFICIFSTGCAETGLEKFTYSELILLQRYLSLEALKRPEWKETVVPSGEWVVGTDIPSGTYSISIIDGDSAYIKIEGPFSLYDSFFYNQNIKSEKENIGRIELKEGYVITISGGTLLFAPPKGLDF